MPMFLRFECGRENLTAPEVGGFAYLQITYGVLRGEWVKPMVGSTPGDFEVAYLDKTTGDWKVSDEFKQQSEVKQLDLEGPWSDVVIGVGRK